MLYNLTMKKILIILFVLYSFLSISAQTKTLTAGVSYSVNELRTIAFENVDKKINMDKYSKYLTYKEFCKNNPSLLIPKKFKFNLTYYSNGTYSVRSKIDSHNVFYYDTNGNLLKIDIYINNGKLDKRISYDRNGNLDAIALDITNSEQLLFDKEKKLVAHWIGNNCYNEKGELIMTRK